jgi:predicted cupin superfamily sugar epimerase
VADEQLKRHMKYPERAGMNSACIIARLGLEPHLEGGYFCRTYTAPSPDNSHPAMSSIYYLLDRASPTGHLHRNRSDILHFWQGGSPVHYTLLGSDGEVTERVMGPDLDAGHILQMLVPGGYWKASELPQGDYGLISEAVCPAFDFAHHQLANADTLHQDYPQHWPRLRHLLSKTPTALRMD